MELLQWIDSGLRIALAGAFALLPGTVIWLSILAAVTLSRKQSRGQAIKALKTRLRQA